jgi:hypothetical protein
MTEDLKTVRDVIGVAYAIAMGDELAERDILDVLKAKAILDRLIAEQEKESNPLKFLDRPEVVEKVAKAVVIAHYHSHGLETLVPYTAEDYANYKWYEWQPETKAAIAAIKQMQERGVSDGAF